MSAAPLDAELLAINARYQAAHADVLAVKGDYPADYDFIGSKIAFEMALLPANTSVGLKVKAKALLDEFGWLNHDPEHYEHDVQSALMLSLIRDVLAMET